MLYPDAYAFVVPTSPRKLLERLINAHRTTWNQLAREPENAKSLTKLKGKLQWSDRDVLVVASIVEKEAVDPAERPRIAQSPKPSAACIAWNEPCRQQGKPDGCDRLHRAQLDDRDNPYNTYQHEGLRPGPIGNPGKASMQAAMKPDGSDYYFFVANTPPTHVFSKTVAEHNAAVDKYQR